MSTVVDEQARVAAVRSYGLLDAARPVVLDDLTGLAASVFETPISTVTLVDRDRQWFAGSTGMPDPQGPRDISFCARLIDDPHILVVPDATRHPTFQGWANVIGAPHIRFYAGAPLIGEDGFVLGSVCVIDDRPRTCDDRRLDLLTTMAGQAASHMSAIRERVRRTALDDELLRAIEREEDIVAAISHELRTPVTAIRGYLEMLTDELALEPYRRFIDPIHRNSERLARMIDHLLAGTRPADTPVTINDETVDLEAVVAEAVAACQAPARQRRTQIMIETTGTGEKVTGDFIRLSQATEQLIHNAVVFSPPGSEVTVRIETGAHPRVRVTDHGAGIPADELPSVMQRFYRGRYARDQALPGVGLGLHIAQRIAAAHSGSVSVTSLGPGHGTTAQLALPSGLPSALNGAVSP
jgi:signal transduction histidine kinase